MFNPFVFSKSRYKRSMLVITCTAFLTSMTTFAAQPTDSVTCSKDGWVRAWSSNMGGSQRFVQEDNAGEKLFYFESYPLKLPRAIGNQTLRMIAAPKIAGNTIRVTLSNKWGDLPTTFSSVYVGLKGEGAAVVAGSQRPVTFNGSSSVTAPAHGEVVSDPISFPIKPFQKVAISFYVPAIFTLPPTFNMDANRTSYLSKNGSGNHASEEAATHFTEQTTSNYFASSIDTWAPAGTVHVSAFGDSFTEPITTTVNAENRPPDYLTRRLLKTGDGNKYSVTMGAISFNFVSSGFFQTIFGPDVVSWGGRPGTQRIVEDALDVPGTRAVLLLHGMNDLAFGATAEQVIAAYQDIVKQAHARGIKVIGATLTPTGAASGVALSYALPNTQINRAKVNDYIRHSGLFDAVVDYDAAVHDPVTPTVWVNSASSDQVHPNDYGSWLEAKAVDLNKFKQVVGCP